MKKVFLFTIATNGYDVIFADWLETQQNYAQKQGYHYCAITKSPPWGISGANSSWLKIPLMLSALKQGYDWVCFLDSDCKIQPDAPPIESVYTPGKSVYMCHDLSGRLNAGVIIAKNEQGASKFFHKVLLFADLPNAFIPKEDINLYEGGHIIFFGKRAPAVAVMDPKWNNTTGESIDEYIWHGRGRYQAKPRVQLKAVSLQASIMKRITEGSRYFLLQRLVQFYKNEYQL